MDGADIAAGFADSSVFVESGANGSQVAATGQTDNTDDLDNYYASTSCYDDEEFEEDSEAEVCHYFAYSLVILQESTLTVQGELMSCLIWCELFVAAIFLA